MENVSMSSERSLCADLLRAKRDREQGVECVPADEVLAAWSGLSRMRLEMPKYSVQFNPRLQRQLISTQPSSPG